MRATITRPAELDSFPLPSWDTEHGAWELAAGYQDPADPCWERWAERKFGAFTVGMYQTWRASEGLATFDIELWGDPFGDFPLRDEHGQTVDEQVRRIATDMLAATEFRAFVIGRDGSTWSEWMPESQNPADSRYHTYSLPGCEVIDHEAPGGERHDQAVLPAYFEELTDPEEVAALGLSLLRAAWVLRELTTDVP